MTTRLDMVLGARLLFDTVFRHQWLAGHLSVKVSPTTMIANTWKRSFKMVQEDDFVELSFDGELVAGEGHVHDTILLHGGIHRRNPDVVAVVHAHPWAAVTLGLFGETPKVYEQETALLGGHIKVLDEPFRGRASKAENVAPLAEDIARSTDAVAFLMPNHGALTIAKDFRAAVLRMISLERMCQRHLDVLAAEKLIGRPARVMSAEAHQSVVEELLAQNPLDLVWNELTARIRRDEPELFR